MTSSKILSLIVVLVVLGGGLAYYNSKAPDSGAQFVETPNKSGCSFQLTRDESVQGGIRLDLTQSSGTVQCLLQDGSSAMDPAPVFKCEGLSELLYVDTTGTTETAKLGTVVCTKS